MPAVLITGAGRGFGRGLFEVYSQRGWTTFPLVRNSDIASQLQVSAEAECHPIIADVTTTQAEHEIAKILEQYCDSLDVLINNAGNIKKKRGLENTHPEDIEDLFRVHCVGVLRCTKVALPHLLKSKRPVVVNISSRFGSIARVISGKGSTIYSYPIAKCAQNMLTACLDQELRKQGLRVFAVHPGRLKTEVGAPDADTDPRDAATALADWVDQVDDRTLCGFHDIMREMIIEW